MTWLLHADVSHIVGLNWKFHGFLYSEISYFFHILDAAVFILLLLWHLQAYWILPLPRILLVHWSMYACMLSLSTRESHHHSKRMTSLDDVSSPSGANKLACAYCQASPAALVASPSSGVPLSSLDHLIWSNIHGDMNFPSVTLPCFICMLFDTSLENSKFEESTEEQNVSVFLLVITMR